MQYSWRLFDEGNQDNHFSISQISEMFPLNWQQKKKTWALNARKSNRIQFTSLPVYDDEILDGISTAKFFTKFSGFLSLSQKQQYQCELIKICLGDTLNSSKANGEPLFGWARNTWTWSWTLNMNNTLNEKNYILVCISWNDKSDFFFFFCKMRKFWSNSECCFLLWNEQSTVKPFQHVLSRI